VVWSTAYYWLVPLTALRLHCVGSAGIGQALRPARRIGGWAGVWVVMFGRRPRASRRVFAGGSRPTNEDLRPLIPCRRPIPRIRLLQTRLKDPLLPQGSPYGRVFLPPERERPATTSDCRPATYVNDRQQIRIVDAAILSPPGGIENAGRTFSELGAIRVGASRSPRQDSPARKFSSCSRHIADMHLDDGVTGAPGVRGKKIAVTKEAPGAPDYGRSPPGLTECNSPARVKDAQGLYCQVGEPLGSGRRRSE